MKPTILTHSGHYFDLLKPKASRICIEDIAHALSNICRFTGHVKRFYSVAEHSYRASMLVPPEHALAALLHDAAEAYIGDVSSPLKCMLPDYRTIEKRIEAAIFEHFGLPQYAHPCVKQADLVMLATERRDLMPAHADEWEILHGIEPLDKVIYPCDQPRSKLLFLTRFFELVALGKMGVAS